MFTTTGIGVIPRGEEIVERPTKYNVYFSFNLKSKNPYQDKKNFIKVNVAVPIDMAAKARAIFVPGSAIQVRIGELVGYRNDTGYVAMTVNTKMQWIEPIKAIPNGERHKNQ